MASGGETGGSLADSVGAARAARVQQAHFGNSAAELD